MKQYSLRVLTGALALVALTACESRQLTGDGLDASPPSIDLLASGNPDSANVALPFPVEVKAGDNLSLLRVRLAAVVGGVSRVVLDTTFSSATPVFKRDLDVSLFGAVACEVVRLFGIADDGSGNTNLDSLLVTVVDPEAPDVDVDAPPPGALHRAGGPLNVTVTASDPSGIGRIGFELLLIGDGGLERVFKRDSVSVGAGATSVTRSFTSVVPDSLEPGTFLLRGFAVDRTGNRAVSSTVAIIVQDIVVPTITILAPPQDSNITVGTNAIVEARITDNAGLARYSVVGVAIRGDPDLGAVDTVIKFDSVFAPVKIGANAQNFRSGLRDTTIRLLLEPRNPKDTTVEAVTFIARVFDIAGNSAVATRRAQLVSGPVVKIIRPGANAVGSPGKSIVVELRATDRDGVKTLGYRVSGPNFNVVRAAPTQTTKRDTLVFIDTLSVPGAFPINQSFSIMPFSTDLLNQPGSGASQTVLVLSPAADATPPRVFQTVRARSEATDSVLIRATDPSGISAIGFVATAVGTGALIATRTVTVNSAFTDVQQSVQLGIPATLSGSSIIITSFARDANGNTGWSVPANAQFPQGNQSFAKADTILVVFGRTYSLPNGGTAADLAVDRFRRVAYVSNMTFDRLDVWQAAGEAFAAKKIAVGADPWGLAIDNSGDTLLVANSGGTNMSRVFIGSADINQVNEVVARRLKTPDTHIFDVTQEITAGDSTHSAITRFKALMYDFSDRPQYVAQTADGKIYYSTLPTPEAPAGSIRFYDPMLTAPDVVIIKSYGSGSGTENVSVMNADSLDIIIKLIPPGDTTVVSDSIVICDHPYGTNQPATCMGGTTLEAVTSALNGAGSDVQLVYGLSVPSLGLTDTTFVAVGGDRRWVAFGEGATPTRAGRVMMAGPGGFFSGVQVSDFTNNAAERVFGLAINANSSSLAARGAEAFFADIEVPFHLRLQGKFHTSVSGAGVAYHPSNMGDTPTLDDPTRVVFIASADGTIEIVDSFHYTSRGRLAVRAPLYGPIRAVLPFPGDDPQIVVKLFGLTLEGMVVIDIRAADIRPLSGG